MLGEWGTVLDRVTRDGLTENRTFESLEKEQS